MEFSGFLSHSSLKKLKAFPPFSRSLITSRRFLIFHHFFSRMYISRSITLESYERRRRGLDSRAKIRVAGTIREMRAAQIEHGIAGRMYNRSGSKSDPDRADPDAFRLDRVAETSPAGNTLFTRYRSGTCGIKNRACGHRNCWIYRGRDCVRALSALALESCANCEFSRLSYPSRFESFLQQFLQRTPTSFVIFSFRSLPSFFSLARSRSLRPLLFYNSFR